MIEKSFSEGILTIRLAHGKASALDLELCNALDAAIIEASESLTVRAMVLTGTGSIFSAGVDLFRIVDGDAEYTRVFLHSLVRTAIDLFAFPKPVVAAINGHAIAGGCILAEACDYRLMAEGKGRIGVPELLVGVPFPPAALEILRFRVPGQHLAPLAFTGATLLPQDALAKGLIDEIVDAESLQNRALEVARQFASIPDEAFRLTKRQLRDDAMRLVRRYAGEFDEPSLAVWENESTRAGIREYLAKTVKK